MRRNKFGLKIMAKDSLTNKVVINHYVFGLSMKNKIGGNGESRDIVIPQNGRIMKKNKQHMNPTQFSC